jgi:hypothetical protein
MIEPSLTFSQQMNIVITIGIFTLCVRLFLNHNDVPWNNNNAENAIKGFATMRRVIGGSSTKAGLRGSLMLLSVCQTFRNKGCSSLDFFHSGKTSLKRYLER